MWHAQPSSLTVWKATRLGDVKLYQESKDAGCSCDYTAGSFENQEKGDKQSDEFTSVNEINLIEIWSKDPNPDNYPARESELATDLN